MTPRGFGGRRAAEVIDAEVTREQALIQVFWGKVTPRESMMLLLPSKQPLHTKLHMVIISQFTTRNSCISVHVFVHHHVIQQYSCPYLPIFTSWQVHKPSFTVELPNWTKLEVKWGEIERLMNLSYVVTIQSSPISTCKYQWDLPYEFYVLKLACWRGACNSKLPLDRY